MSCTDYSYSSNAWGYCPCGDRLSCENIAERICALGFDGFDLLIGPESFPALPVDADEKQLAAIRQAAESAGGAISSIVLVGFNLQDEEDCRRQLELAPGLANLMGAKAVHLLPRKTGISHVEGFRRLAGIWKKHGPPLLDAGLLVTAENHIWNQDADEDIFLVRLSGDFDRLLEATNGQVKIKFDPSWLWKGGEDPIPSFKRLLPHIDILDLKDFRDGRFVTPGEGIVDFRTLADIVKTGDVRLLSVEAEQHNELDPPLGDSEIDRVHAEALDYYRRLFRMEHTVDPRR